AEPRRHVAHDDIPGATELLEQEGLDSRLTEIPPKDLDSGERRDGGRIYSEHPAGGTDALASDLRPSSGRGPEINDHIPLPEQAVSTIDLGKLDRGPTPVGLLLRRPVEPVMVTGLHPRLAHGANEDGGAP